VLTTLTCGVVLLVDQRKCRLSQPITVTSQSGSLASMTSQHMGLGTVECPWRIRVSPGQQITLFLRREPADVQLLRVSDRVSVDDAGRIRQWGIPQYNVVRRSTARTTRAVYVEFERTQCAGCRSDDAQNSRTIYHQLSRLLTSIVVS